MERKEKRVKFGHVRQSGLALLTACLLTVTASAERVQDPNNPAASYEMDPEVLARDAGAPGAMITAAQDDSASFLCDIQSYQYNTFGGTDVWGYEDAQGREYALMGTYEGITVTNVTDQVTVGTIPYTPGCGWRDIKTYSHYAYATSECNGTNGGVLIIDLQYLPDSIAYEDNIPIDGGFAQASHNLSIDTLKGYMYVEGAFQTGRSIYIHSLANPASPTYINDFGPGEVHDMYCMNDTCYVAAGRTDQWEIWDMSNKNVPVRIAQVTIPNAGYVHNVWPSDDRKYAVTTEETAFKTIKIWDIQDLGNIQLIGQFLGPSDLAHNAHWEGDKVYLSHYESGVIVADVSDPSNPQIIHQFDTWGGEDPDFDGCWGVYPHTSSGLIYASNRDGHLFVLQEFDIDLTDSLYGGEVSASAGDDVAYDIFAYNSFPTQVFIVPISYAGELALTLDSVTTVGTRTESFSPPSLIGSFTQGKQKVYRIQGATALPPGDGPVLTAWFSVPSILFGQNNPITFKPLGSNSAQFGGSCIQADPDTVSGAIVVGGCCSGNAGNIDNDPSDEAGPADLAYLVDYLFSAGSAPVCPEEADVNGDGSAADPTDLSYFVEYLFNSGVAPAGCQ